MAIRSLFLIGAAFSASAFRKVKVQGEESEAVNQSEAMSLSSDQRTFSSLMNQYRRDLGLGRVCYNSALNAAAKAHAMDLFRQNLSVRHVMPDGSCHAWRTVRQGYCYSRVGECAGSGRQSVTHMFNGWRASPTHDRVMRNANYNEMGMWCNPRSVDPLYRCVLKMGSHMGGRRCCVENGCAQTRETCCGPNSDYPRRTCRTCCRIDGRFMGCP
jgi:uncharacterized protein YkwD